MHGHDPLRPSSPAQPAGSRRPVSTSPAAPQRRPPASVAAGPSGHAADDLVPLMTRRHWIGLAWGAFTAASAVALASSGRMMFPNVLNEPSQHFKAGFPAEYGVGVDERWKDKFGVWLVRTAEDLVHDDSGFYALIAVCTHLGCTPNYLAAEQQIQVPVPRQRLSPHWRQLRRPGAAAARTVAHRAGG